MENSKEVEDDKRAVRYKEKEIRQKRERESKWDGNLKREKPDVKLMELLIITSFLSQTKPGTADVWPCSCSSWLQMFSPWGMFMHHLAQTSMSPSQMTQTAYSVHT